MSAAAPASAPASAPAAAAAAAIVAAAAATNAHNADAAAASASAAAAATAALAADAKQVAIGAAAGIAQAYACGLANSDFIWAAITAPGNACAFTYDRAIEAHRIASTHFDIVRRSGMPLCDAEGHTAARWAAETAKAAEAAAAVADTAQRSTYRPHEKWPSTVHMAGTYWATHWADMAARYSRSMATTAAAAHCAATDAAAAADAAAHKAAADTAAAAEAAAHKATADAAAHKAAAAAPAATPALAPPPCICVPEDADAFSPAAAALAPPPLICVPEDADAFYPVATATARPVPTPGDMHLIAELLETLSSNKRRITELEHRAATVELEHTASLYEMEHRIDVLTARAAEADTGHRRIAELEHKVHLLTEAATMLLGMKAEAEHIALKRAEANLANFPLREGCVAHKPPTHVAFTAPMGWGENLQTEGTRSKEHYLIALGELESNTTKTDTLLAALHSS